MKKSYRILQAPIPAPILHVHITLHYTSIQRILHPASRIQFYMQKTESSSSTTFQKRNSTHRRQGDLLEMHPCVFQEHSRHSSRKSFQRQLQRHSSLSRHSRHFSLSSLSRHSSRSRHSRDIPDIPVIHDLPAFPGNSTNSTCSSISRDSTPVQHSPIRMHILQFDWFPQKTSPSTS